MFEIDQSIWRSKLFLHYKFYILWLYDAQFGGTSVSSKHLLIWKKIKLNKSSTCNPFCKIWKFENEIPRWMHGWMTQLLANKDSIQVHNKFFKNGQIDMVINL
jgi:hypothetical protein